MRRALATFVLLVAAISAAFAGLAAPPVLAEPIPDIDYCVEVQPPWPDDDPPWVRVCTP